MIHRSTGRFVRVSTVLAVTAVAAVWAVLCADAQRLADTMVVEYKAKSTDTFSFTLKLPRGWKALDIAEVRADGVGVMSRPNLEGPNGVRGVVDAVIKANDPDTVEAIRTGFDDIRRISEERWLERTNVISFGDWTALLTVKPFHSQLQKGATYAMFVYITTRKRDRLLGMKFYFHSSPTIDMLAEVEMIVRSLKETSQ